MLDETTCPVCGRRLDLPAPGSKERNDFTDGIWAVAHYLAHLAQQNATRATLLGVSHSERPSDVGLEDWLRKFNEFVDSRYVRLEVDNIPPPTR